MAPAPGRVGRLITAMVVASALVVAVAAPAAAKAKPTPADRVLLNAGVVRAGDVPAGWTSASQMDTSASQFQGVRGCGAVYRTVFDARATVPYKLSKAFSPPGPDNGLTSVDDTVLAFKNATRAGRFAAVFEEAGTAACLQAVIAKALRGVGRVAVAPLGVAPVGDAAIGYQATITPTSATALLPQVGTIVVLRVGRVVAYVTTLNAAAGPLPQGPAVLSAIATRLRRAGA